jgi:hypothetical protein
MLKKRLIAVENRFSSRLCQVAGEMPKTGVTLRYQAACFESFPLIIYGVY